MCQPARAKKTTKAGKSKRRRRPAPKTSESRALANQVANAFAWN